MIKIIMIMALLVFSSGCLDVETEGIYEKRNACRDRVDILSCEKLLECDKICNDFKVTNRITACHSSFTNYIIAKC